MIRNTPTLLTARIIDRFNQTAHEGMTYGAVFSRIMRRLNCSYSDIRKAFRIHCDLDLGNKSKRWSVIVKHEFEPTPERLREVSGFGNIKDNKGRVLYEDAT